MALLEEKVDSLTHHFQVYKTDMQDVKNDTRDIKNLLAGSELNGKKGLIHLFEGMADKIDILEAKQLVNDEYNKNVKFVAQGLVTAIIGFFLWLFTNK
jgi:hypothetical protein